MINHSGKHNKTKPTTMDSKDHKAMNEELNQLSFISNKYGVETTLRVGQKVECSYYQEYGRWFMKSAYKRKWWQLFDLPFKPVKIGVIVGDAGTHPYWLAEKDGKEQYLLVKFKEYFFAKPIPISCIIDAKQSAEIMARLLNENT
jgi:hypothetical protein